MCLTGKAGGGGIQRMVSTQIVNVQAREAGEIQARDYIRTSIGEAAPPSIQLFPPGVHKINAKGGDGNPVSLSVNVTEATAAAIKSCFDQMTAAAEAGTGPRPYLDFNHDDKEASGWPTDVFWAGNDPVTGGVRAKMTNADGVSTWSKPGEEAITGRSYRAFSPNFQFDRESGSVVGTGPNMGGLVNRPAFRAIQPLSAKDAEQPNNVAMNKIQQALLAAGLISATATTDDVMASEFTLNYDALRKRQTSVQASEATILAKHADIVEVNKGLATDNQRLRLRHAEMVVAKAVSEGRIAPKDETARKLWLDVIAKDEDNAGLLESLTAKPNPTAPIVTAKTGPKTGPASGHPFIVAAKAHAELHKQDLAKSIAACAVSDPVGYDAYRTGVLFVAA